MSLESDVAALTQATTDLLKAVNVQKSYLDAAAKAAIEGVTVQGAIAPTPGKSPVGDSRGKFAATWIDPESPIATTYPVAVGITSKSGYNYSGQNPPTGLWYRIATFAPDSVVNAQHLRIDGVLNDNWQASGCGPFVLLLGVRGGFYYDMTINGPASANARILVLLQENGAFEVYLHFRPGTFGSASFNLLGYATTTYAQPVSVPAVPAGAVVYDTGDVMKYPPRWKGMSPGAGTSFDSLVEVRAQDGATSSTSYIAGAPKANVTAANVDIEVVRHGVAGNAGVNSAGFIQWLASAGNGSAQKEGYKLSLKARDTGSGSFTPTLLSVSGNGMVYAPLLKAGSSDPSSLRHNISRGTGQGAEIIYFGVDNAPAPSVAILASNGVGNWSPSTAVLYVGKNSTTDRSISASGTVNTFGNDYAEYIFKCPMCGNVAAGQIIGITINNQITDKWIDSTMFAIKSTAPSFVGGDSWANNVGPRPSPQAGQEPTQPLRREDAVTQQPVPGANPPEYEDVITEPGDTDDEWAEKHAAYIAALAAHDDAVQQDAEAMAAFDAALEVERQKVDRIAIAGRVPVNVQGAQPGDYIVPAQDGVGIKGIAVHEDDLSMKQYFRAVGRVISIEPDGRAYVMVKVV